MEGETGSVLKNCIEIDDYFADLNMKRHKVGRTHFSEFFTPRAMAEHAAVQAGEMLMCKYSKFNQGALTVIEPSVGTGSMLMALIRYLSGYPDILKRVHFIVNDLSQTNIEATTINYALAAQRLPLNKLTCLNGNALEELKPYLGKADLVIGNPPFHNINLSHDMDIYLPSQTTNPYRYSIEQGYLSNLRSKDESTMKPAPKAKKTVNLAISILELAHLLVKPLGVVVMVIPNNVLSNTAYRSSRIWLLDTGSVLSVQQFPTTAFKLCDTTVQTSLVVLTKYIDLGYTFFYEIESIGWDTRMREIESDLNSGDIQYCRAACIDAYQQGLRQYRYMKVA